MEDVRWSLNLIDKIKSKMSGKNVSQADLEKIISGEKPVEKRESKTRKRSKAFFLGSQYKTTERTDESC